ncbi:MAG: S8 family serine peptidase [Acidobacteriota bacterium]|nr:S8 family serine peptidase [Acidobacteriota bacterium]
MAIRKKTLLGEGFRKVQPKLRVISNGSAKVNALRSEQCGGVIVSDNKLLEEVPVAITDQSCPVQASELPKSAKRGSMKKLPENVYTNVFIQTVRPPKEGTKLPGETARRGNIITATVNFKELKELADDENVSFVEMGANVSAPTPDISNAKVAEPLITRWNFGSATNHRDGENILVGIIDVQGFDFSHPDFLDDTGKTRFLRIWDQGGETRVSPRVRDAQTNPETFDYGSEFTKEQLDTAIGNAAAFNLPAYRLEPQSQMDESSHGTHVASIAAGNHGVCSKAMIAGVVVSLSREDNDRRRNFFDSTRLAHAVDYLINLAKELGVPVAINISLGTNGHAHDGSSALNRWIDSAVALPGRAICVAAGNAGQEVAQFDGDVGYVMGRIHTSGVVPARGLVADIEWLVVGNGIADISENELEIWYSSQDRFTVSVKPPGMDWIGPIEPRSFIENKQLSDKTFISVYNEVYNPANGSNYISVYLSPFLNESGIVGVPAGQWTVRLHGLEVKDGRYHGWIERDDPRRVGKIGDNKFAWRFPSFFSQKSMVDNSSVSSLGCGFRVISVANLDEAKELINITSSQGPTRDGRFKPDVAAPGTQIIAANGFAAADKHWVAMTGTSMASPFVTGVIGLMLATEPNLTAAQIEGIVQCTSRPLPGADFKWLNTAGFGRIAPENCLEEAASINQRKEIK